MKNKIISVAVSLVFIPVALLGQILGTYIGSFFAWFNQSISWFSIPEFMQAITTGLVGGFVAGMLSASVVYKVYKNVNVKFATIIPSIVIIIAFFGDTMTAINYSFDKIYLEHVVRNIFTIVIYYNWFKELEK